MSKTNILLPAMGSSQFFEESFYPKPLIEIAGKPMIQRVIENYDCVREKQIITILSDTVCREFHIDRVVRLLTGGTASTVVLKGQTAGALCTCLMAVDYINTDEPLIVANSDHTIDADIQKYLEDFAERKLDCALLCFKSIHPRWSYVLTEGDSVVQVAEKVPLSDKAIAGFYWFKTGASFVEAAKKAILKGAMHDGKYYISASINEIILSGGKVGYTMIDANKYHSFYSPAKVVEAERILLDGQGGRV